jgi:hypothetical protein
MYFCGLIFTAAISIYWAAYSSTDNNVSSVAAVHEDLIVPSRLDGPVQRDIQQKMQALEVQAQQIEEELRVLADEDKKEEDVSGTDHGIPQRSDRSSVKSDQKHHLLSQQSIQQQIQEFKVRAQKIQEELRHLAKLDKEEHEEDAKKTSHTGENSAEGFSTVTDGNSPKRSNKIDATFDEIKGGTDTLDDKPEIKTKPLNVLLLYADDWRHDSMVSRT